MPPPPQTIPFGQEASVDQNWSPPATLPFSAANPSAPAPTAAPQTGYNPPIVDLVNKLGSYFGNSIGGAAQAGIGQIKQAASDITSGKENPVQGAESGLSLGSGVVSLLSSPLAPLLKPLGAAVSAAGNVGDALAYLSTKVGLMSPQQKAAYDAANANFANSGVGKGITRVATDAANAGNIAGGILGAKGVVDVAPKVASAVAAAPDAIAAKLVPPAAAPDAAADSHITSVANDWQSPSKVNIPAYNKARAVIAKDPSIPTTLAKAGINPFANVEDGKYATADTAEQLRGTADQISKDVVRPSLQMADYTVPKTPVDDLELPSQLQVETNFGVTAGDAAKIKGAISDEVAALKEKYPEGMSLSNMHDEKINYSQNSGYSQFKSNADTNSALANKALSLTLKDAIETNVPKEAPIHETNAYLSKLYSAADYLEALNGKKAPASVGQNVARFAARFGGAAIARHVAPGFGDIVSSFAGYQIGKAIENALENMTNAGRAEFLGNLQHTNPDVVQKLQAYLQSPK